MRWTTRDLTLIELVAEVSEGDIVTARFGTPSGEVQVMATVAFEGRTMLLKGAHSHGMGGPRSVGLVNLRVLAEFALERLDCDEARIEGAVRTTGANPGHQPRQLRFTRRHRNSRCG